MSHLHTRGYVSPSPRRNAFLAAQRKRNRRHTLGGIAIVLGAVLANLIFWPALVFLIVVAAKWAA